MSTSDGTAAGAWALLVYQLPTRPTNLRVRTWRRLRDLGAVALKNGAYVLPNSAQCREDFAWLKSEIQSVKGEAAVFAADTLDESSARDIADAFRAAREQDYAALLKDAKAWAGRHASGGRPPRRAMTALRRLRERLGRLDAVTAVPPSARQQAAALVAGLETRAGGRATPASTGPRLDRARFQGRLWVTRPRPGVDRMSSAWLIRRFIDPRARFAFAASPPRRGRAIPFDMFGVEFGHTGHGCTFETLLARFGLRGAPLQRIGRIVHDLDLKEERFGEPEVAALGPIVEGLRASYSNDAALLDQGMRLFEALYRGL